MRPSFYNMRRNWPTFALIAFTLLVYSRTLTNGFVYYDDGLYVFDNEQVRHGLSWAGVRYVFLTGETGTWQPLALLSHMLDCEWFGLAPWGHHLTNVLLHAANVWLLLAVLSRITNNYAASWFVAAVFALHPAHVESVAWIAERKDVLSTLFGLLTIAAYARYARRPSLWRNALVCLLLALGLMAKPMLVTLPFVLMLLDYWPLRRVTVMQSEGMTRMEIIRRLLIEKWAMFVLVAASSAITLIVQRQAQAVVSLENLPVIDRCSNAAVSYLRYIGLMLWPSGLAVHYPFPAHGIPQSQVVTALAALISASAAAVLLRRRAPYLLTGWFWYVGTLVPVIGFVQVGTQSMADRYTYIPTIGLTMLPAWGLPHLWQWVSDRRPGRPWRLPSQMRAVAAALLAGGMGTATWVQIGHWKSTETMWLRAVTAVPKNETALRNLGFVYIDRGRFEESIPYLEAATKLDPANESTMYHLGRAHQELGQMDLAKLYYRKAIDLDSRRVETWISLGQCLLAQGLDSQATETLQKALEISPDHPEAMSNLGVALCKTGRFEEAVGVLSRAIVKHPNHAGLRNSLGIALNAVGRRLDAIREFREALRIQPDSVEAAHNLQALEVGPGR
ncbi:MAG: hypothetical protein AMXMBFR4_32770 [Candidatus Hydrogenedentota bacterium]